MSFDAVMQHGEAVKLGLSRNDFLEIHVLSGAPLVDLTFLSYSQGYTIDNNMAVMLTEGNRIYDINNEPVLVLSKVRTQSRINILFPGCIQEYYEDEQLGCREILSNILNTRKSQLPSTVNLFMDVEIHPSGQLTILNPNGVAGDFVTLEALENVDVGVSVCPWKISSVEKGMVRVVHKTAASDC